METPILVVDRNGQVSVFETGERASTWMEAQDVRDGEYRVFGPSGREYEVTADSNSGPVRIGVSTTKAFDFEAVRDLVAAYLHEIPTKKRRHRERPLSSEADIRVALKPYLIR